MSEPITLRGVITKVFHASPTFSAGLLKSENGASVKFRGALCANVGDTVALVGTFVKDPKFGKQFNVDRLSYELPQSADGLVQYLARHDAFKGIGESNAAKLVEYAKDAAGLERALAGDLNVLHQVLKVPVTVLVNLRDAWKRNSNENALRTYLASFNLTERQMNTLIDQFGESVVGVLRQNPYQLIDLVDGYGFKRADQIARSMGTPKDHAGRIDAALLYALDCEIDAGHTWTDGAALVDLADKLLFLDSIDGRQKIQQRARALVDSGRLLLDGIAVTNLAMSSAEKAIATVLAEFKGKTVPIQPPVGYHDELKSGQLDAYNMALRHPVCVISGGAGTGKTFVVSRLTKAFMSMGFNIALCAPTGKAAKRIEEVLRKHSVDLQAKTLHRLLHYNGREFLRESLSQSTTVKQDENETDAAPVNVVIVDEVSMIDVPLMHELLKRIDLSRTRLILVGDHNQLPPVGPGNILRDLIHQHLVPAVVLNEVVRQAGLLKLNCTGILNGSIAASATAEDGWLVVDDFKSPDDLQVYLRELVLTYIPKHFKFDPVRDVQILTPQHKGPLGTQSINRIMQYLLHGDVQARFVPGDKVIQTQNDYELGVMNGTLGYVLEVSNSGCQVQFDGEGSIAVEGDQLLNLQLAYALTAHKAQGSEFPCVVVLCHKSHYFADRNWLYTACTRAARTCILVGDQWGMQNAARKNQTHDRRTLLSKWAIERKRGGQPR